MLVNSELTWKHDEALNSACNRFLPSEPTIVTKNGIFYTDLLPGALLKQKYFVAHTLQKRFFYTPGIYADGYIVFAFPFVRSSVRMFVSSLVR